MRKLVSVCTIVALLLTMAAAPVAAGKPSPTVEWSVCDPGPSWETYQFTVSWDGIKAYQILFKGSTTPTGGQTLVNAYEPPGKVKSPIQQYLRKSSYAIYTYLWVYAETRRGDNYDAPASVISTIPPCQP